MKRSRILGRMLAALAIAVSLAPAAASQAQQLRAGAARVDITPPATMLPAAGLVKLSAVHDPIYARLLLLDNGRERIALISVDAIILARGSDLLASVARELKIPSERILIAATHDHNAPIVGLPNAYFDFVGKALVEAARQAVVRAQPARIGFRTGKAYVNANRDEKIGDRYTMGYAPDGPSDKTVAVLTVTDAAGKPIAIYANYAVHGVVMFGSGLKTGTMEITGDLPGATSRMIEDRLGNGAVALWTSGAAGDQNPLFSAVRPSADGGFEDAGAGGWTLVDVQARRLGDEIVRIVRATVATTGTADLKVATSSLVCPGRRLAKIGPSIGPATSNQAPPQVEMVDAEPVTIPLTLMSIGDFALAGVAGELFTEIGMAVKEQSPFTRTMVVTNLPDGVGYIPSDRAYALPAEKASTNPIRPGCADAGIPRTFRSMAAGLLTRDEPGDRRRP